ncbi:MAG: vitamin B12-dependent ribonucleotide reductase [bacterium]|nr:vitamin B12-dependent ribonucleotide reductase [bacterium]
MPTKSTTDTKEKIQPENNNFNLFNNKKVNGKQKDKSNPPAGGWRTDYSNNVIFSDNALKVINKRYVIKDENLNPLESPKNMLERVASVTAKVDAKYGTDARGVKKLEREFFELMAKLEFLPNSPTFTGAGTKLGQLSACFVLPVEDDMEEILRTQMNMGIIHKSGGGTGFSFSRLRPKNDIVGSTGGISCGPIGFMQMFNDTTEQIKQGGSRRGANMGILRVDHPDIIEFIKYKSQEGTLANFNISVGVTKEFMNALKNNEEYELINPRNQKTAGKLKAKEVFDLITDYAWKNGEPGLIFLDHINEANTVPHLGEIESTNPCGEQPLLPYESCNLGAINLAKMVGEDENGKPILDEEKLRRTIYKVVHFLDNIIDANKYPIKEIEDLTLKTRKIGITIMGFADLLYALGIAYDSNEGINMAEHTMGIVEEESHKVSQELAKTRGTFPAYKGSKWDKLNIKMHNAATTSCNPTGTLSIIASCSSGIEPFFALAYVKTVMDGTPLPEVNPHFLKIAKERGFYSEELIKKVLNKGTLKDIEEVPEDIKRVFVVSQDIAPEWHVKMQAAFQRHTDAAISKTINFPNSATREDVAKSYLMAYDLNCKGITIYRDGSRAVQVLTVGDKKAGDKSNPSPSAQIVEGYIQPRKRPEVVQGFTYKIKTGYGSLYVTINDDENGNPFEIFASIGKTGGYFAAKAEAIGRLTSLALRSDIDPQEIIEQLKGIRGPSPIWASGGSMVLSMPDAIGQLLEKHLKSKNAQLTLDIQAPATEAKPETIVEAKQAPAINHKSMADYGHAPVCPECGTTLEMGEGCLKCPSCGFSKCG